MFHAIEVPVSCYKQQPVLASRGGYPDIVLWYRHTRAAQLVFDVAVVLGGLRIARQNLVSGGGSKVRCNDLLSTTFKMRPLDFLSVR